MFSTPTYSKIEVQTNSSRLRSLAKRNEPLQTRSWKKKRNGKRPLQPPPYEVKSAKSTLTIGTLDINKLKLEPLQHLENMILQQGMMKFDGFQLLQLLAGTPNRICRPLQISSNSPTATEGGRSVVKELSYLATRRRHKATVGDLQKGKSDLTKALTLKADSHLHRPAVSLAVTPYKAGIRHRQPQWSSG
ncbi:hypothetical protein DY000_02024903 [Brassica cretica]|uniref:Uncharacterized protein n=1 Tax=Brassica cretica TaxID=69181 RepID=A0ABQ7EFX9_BRACR|nr:hypothetical protein DY000_02024903 [Brassica cretica]